MSQQSYICPECGNTDAFTELVWEQRRYPIDGAGETTSVSEPVEETQVPIQVSCACCGTVVKQLEVSVFRASAYLTNYRPQEHVWKGSPQDWEDLPAYADFEDTNSRYQAQFLECIATDDLYEFDTILQEYEASPPDKRFVMNWLFIRLCGYSLPNIIKKAHGRGPDDEETNQPSKARRTWT